MSHYCECSDVVSGTPLRQGDVIWPLEKSNDPWAGPAIIVTADCDLARNKHNGRLSCVPVLTVEKYLSTFYMPNRLSKVLATAENRLGSVIREYQAKLIGFDEPMDDRTAAAWITETEDGNIEDTLAIDKADRSLFRALARSYCAAAASTSSEFTAQTTALLDLQVAIGQHKSYDHAQKAHSRETIQFIQRLPGDAMFLNSLSGDMTGGYIAYLRVLRELTNDEVAIRGSMRSFRIRYERISRLRAPFVYALSQQLGAVFSSIGLPDEYEQARQRRAETIVSAMGQVED